MYSVFQEQLRRERTRKRQNEDMQALQRSFDSGCSSEKRSLSSEGSLPRAVRDRDTERLSVRDFSIDSTKGFLSEGYGSIESFVHNKDCKLENRTNVFENFEKRTVNGNSKSYWEDCFEKHRLMFKPVLSELLHSFRLEPRLRAHRNFGLEVERMESIERTESTERTESYCRIFEPLVREVTVAMRQQGEHLISVMNRQVEATEIQNKLLESTVNAKPGTMLKLVSILPSFDGHGFGLTFMRFLRDFERCREIEQWDEVTSLRFLKLVLTGLARQQLDRANVASYEQAVAALLERFCNRDVIEAILPEFEALLQESNESLVQYYGRVLEIGELVCLRYPKDFKSTELLRVFLKGLRDTEVRLATRRAKPCDIFEALKIAQEEEALCELCSTQNTVQSDGMPHIDSLNSMLSNTSVAESSSTNSEKVHQRCRICRDRRHATEFCPKRF